MANIFWTKHHRQSGKDIAKHEQSPTLSHNFINFGPQTAKMGPEINPLSVNSAFCFVARRRTQRSANGAQPNFAKRDWCQPNKVVPHSECKCNHRNWVAGMPEPPKHSTLAMAQHRAAFSGNTLLIATFSSCL